MTERQRILGIDPGSRKTGFGVVDCTGDSLHYVASGAVNSSKGDFPDRLRLIFESVREIVDDYRPQVIAIESVFVHKNPSSALKLGHARSAAICATFGFGLEFHEYAPRAVKQAVVGTGSASKEQVVHMVRSMLQLDGDPSTDAADAIALAVCHANQRRLAAALKGHRAMAGSG